MTSGILITAKNYDSSLRLATQISDRAVKKFYICEVEGHFPNKLTNDESHDTPGVIHCAMPLGPLSSKFGLHGVLSEDAGGKPSRTHFVRLSYDPMRDTSLVLCRLFTGRTHQIRVHLQYLGFPIVNDPLYNTTIWGEHKGKGAEYAGRMQEIVERFSASSNSRILLNCVENQDPAKAYHNLQARLNASSLDVSCRDRLLQSFDSNCPNCCQQLQDPDPKDLILKLHAYQYSGSGWCYTAPLPDWATDNGYSVDLSDVQNYLGTM